MRPARLAPVVATLGLLQGCFTMTLTYDAVLEREAGKAAASYEGHVDTTGHGVACILTAFVYGGWCWAYMAMPFEGQEAGFRHEARREIRRRLAKTGETGRPEFLQETVERSGWNDTAYGVRIVGTSDDDAGTDDEPREPPADDGPPDPDDPPAG